MRHNLHLVVAIAAALKGRDIHEVHTNQALVASVLTKHLSSHCKCCGHRLSVFYSMKSGYGPLCAAEECLCKG